MLQSSWLKDNSSKPATWESEWIYGSGQDSSLLCTAAFFLLSAHGLDRCALHWVKKKAGGMGPQSGDEWSYIQLVTDHHSPVEYLY